MIEELKRYPCWVVCRQDKVPLRAVDGKAASSVDPADWSDFETAVTATKANPGTILGFVLSTSNPFAVIDLDDPSNSKHKLTPEEIEKAYTLHKQIYDAFDSYSEKSPSGKGLHIWLKGSVPKGLKNTKACVEVYSAGRFMTVTGWAHNNVDIKDRSQLIMSLWEQMGGKKTVQASNATFDAPQTIEDTEIIRLCSIGDNGNGELFQRLFKGDWGKDYSSQSEADISICNIIAFYSDNQQQVGRIFRQSGLANRKKALRDDYLFNKDWGIVTKAFDRKGPTIENIRDVIVESKKSEEEDEEESEIDGPDAVDWKALNPGGLMGDIASFVYSNSVNPMPEVAIAASIAYLAGIAGRGWNYSKTGLNQYIILLAETGQGKESAAQGMDRITHEIIKTMPAFNTFIGPANIVSSESLIKQLNETPCFLSHKGEFGVWLQKLTGKYARSNEVSLRGMLLDLYSKSGYTQTLRGAIYSDRSKNVPNIDAPALSLFGDSTQQEFFKALDEDNISEGLISRFTTIQCTPIRPEFNANHGKVPINPDMIVKLKRLADLALQSTRLAPFTVNETPEANKLHMQYREQCMDKVWKDNKDITAKIWNRAHLRMLRLSGLIAVSRNPEMPIVTESDIEFAKIVINHSVEVIAHKFAKGEIGSVTNYNLDQTELLSRTIRRFCSDGFNPKWERAYGIDKPMYDARVITDRYLQNNCIKHSCFRNDKNPLMAFKTILNSLCDAGNIKRFELGKVDSSRRQGIAYYVTDLRGLGK